MNINEKFYCSRCMQELEDDMICPHCGFDPSAPLDAAWLEEGTLLHEGRYQLGAVLGSGGFGITYAAWDHILAIPVAIKEYFPKGLCRREPDGSGKVSCDADEQNRAVFQVGLNRFNREARVLSTLQNIKSVVSVLDWFEANGTGYIVMEFVRGRTIEAYVKEKQPSADALLAMFRELIDALIAVHAQGILHRDISPSNIMVEEGGTLKLIDFGAATVAERREQGMDQTVIFNRRFAPIEQYDVNGEQGPWTDVYALSATLYYLLTGHMPQESISRVGTNSGTDFRGSRMKRFQMRAISEGMAIQPDNRIRSMEHFRSVLYNLPLPEEVRLRKRFMRWAGTIIAAVVLSAVLISANMTTGFLLGDSIWYSLHTDGFHIVGYSGEQSELVLPERRLGIPVSGVDAGAFQGNTTLQQIVIPGSVSEVGEFAFNSCEALTNVVLGQGVLSLGAQSFSGCSALQVVEVPASLIEISDTAFSSSSDRLVMMGELDVPAADRANELQLCYANMEFAENDSGLTLLAYNTLTDETARIPDAVAGMPITVIGSPKEKTSVFPDSIHSVQLPAHLLRLDGYAFAFLPIQQIALPDKLEVIGEYAFTQSHLRSITLPDSVIQMGNGAFSSCVRLEQVILPSGLQMVPAGCFEGCGRLTEVSIPQGIQEISTLAFSSCVSLDSIRFPEGLQKIGPYAMQDCIALKAVHIPRSVQTISNMAFSGCPSTLTISGYSGTEAEYYSANKGYRFNDMKNYDLHMPASVTGGMVIAEDTPEIETVFLPDFFMDNPVNHIVSAQGLKSRFVTLPRFTQEINTTAFYANEYLESIVCSEYLERIGDMAFANCSNLVSVQWEDGLNHLGKYAFVNCSGLTDITLPDSLANIQQGAFMGCSGMKEITIPASLTLLNADVFAKTGITAVTVPGNVSKCRNAFYGCRQLASVVIEEGCRELWGTFADCSMLKSIVLPSSMERISQSTFRGCTSLTDVWLYSDTVDLEFLYPGVSHVEVHSMEDLQRENLEIGTENEDLWLFRDCPKVTLHGHLGSAVEAYARAYGIPFEPIDSEQAQVTGRSSDTNLADRINTTSELREKLTPSEEDSAGILISKLRYIQGYGIKDLEEACLDILSRCKEPAYQPILLPIQAFLTQRPEHNYLTGRAIALFEDGRAHSSLQTGDIIVTIDGIKLPIRSDISPWLRSNPDGPWEYTVLRMDRNGQLEELTVAHSQQEPRIGGLEIGPMTFDNP